MGGFDSIYGNDLIKRQLRTAIAGHSLRHAYMFCGEKGMGKKTLTEAFLLELFCTAKSMAGGKPCMSCPDCRKILSRNHPDVIYVTHEKESTVSVKEIREEVVEDAAVRPYLRDIKVYVIADAELMSVQAQNALLKTLEEPPEYVVILLLVSDAASLLDTVCSRAVTERMTPLKDSVVRNHLMKELGASAGRADICTALAGGNLGRAVSLLSDEAFMSAYEKLTAMLASLGEMSAAGICAETAGLLGVYPDAQRILDLTELWFRDVMICAASAQEVELCMPGTAEAAQKAAGALSPGDLSRISERIGFSRERLRAGVHPGLTLELLFLYIQGEYHGQDSRRQV